MKIQKIMAAVMIAAALVVTVMAQDEDMKGKPEAKDYSKDVATMDTTLAALYESISGGAGVQRDWDRFRNLFHPEARLIPTGRAQATGLHNATVFSPDGYIERAEGFLMQNGFFEKEIARKTIMFGNIVHVFSTYEGRNKQEDEKPFLRGINSIQLLNDNKRWWIITVYWQAETPQNPLPAEFIP